MSNIDIDLDMDYRVPGEALAQVFAYLSRRPWIEVVEAIPLFYDAIEPLGDDNGDSADNNTDS